jgi:AraC family transcriptional activator FtrA
MTIKRALIYTLGFFGPPILLGLYLLYNTAQRVMVHRPPAPLSDVVLPTRAKPTKQVALIALGRGGTQATDLLASAEILGEKLDVWTAGPSRALLPTTGAVAVLPDATYLEAPHADLLVIPALITELDTPLIDWIRARAEKARVVLALSDGVIALAQTGLLDGKTATAHPTTLENLRKFHPRVQWNDGLSFVEDGKFITSPGIVSTLDAATRALERATGAKSTLQAQATSPAPEPGFREMLMLFVRGGYFWGDPRLAIELKAGVSEIELAALLDTFPRTMTAEVLTVSAKREPIRTRHGLTLVATQTTADALVEPQASQSLALESENEAPSQAFPRALRSIIEGSDDRASATELVTYIQGMIALPAPVRVVGDDFTAAPLLPSPHLWIRFFTLGFFSLALTFLIERRFRLQ